MELFHNEARENLIQGLENTPIAGEAAESFSGNQGTVYRLKRPLDETGSIETRICLRKNSLSEEAIHKWRPFCCPAAFSIARPMH